LVRQGRSDHPPKSGRVLSPELLKQKKEWDAGEATREAALLKKIGPEGVARLRQLQKDLGQSLVDNLNRNVRKGE
jgi:hypothetical protein